ncbi:MAG TPA: DoxX family membrane protein [Cytophagales bacterium]|nr:DoxX family membrane protein [Cytophagales bacterium]
MKTAVLIVRILFGALLIFSSLNFFFNFMPMEMPEGEAQKFFIGMSASVYMFPLIKIIELVVGLVLISGYYIPLASIVIFPISLNIFLFHLFLAPAGLGMSVFVLGANLFLAYYYRRHYKTIFETGKSNEPKERQANLKMQEELK